MSDTPRTDAAERECACAVNGAVINGVVTAAFARQLERELASCEQREAEAVKAAMSLGRELAAANEAGENLHAKYRETEAALINARRELAESKRLEELHYNRLAGLLFSGRMDSLTGAECRAFEAEYVDAKRELATAREALADIADGPGDLEAYHNGIRCGLEDRDLQNGSQYVAAEYGYDQGLDWCADIARRALKTAAKDADEDSARMKAGFDAALEQTRLAVEPEPEVAELVKRLRAYSVELRELNLGITTDCIDDTAEALSRLAALQADAERYRWLRDEAHPDREDTGLACTESDMNDWGNYYTKHLSGDQLDTAIDAARKAAPEASTDGGRKEP